MVRLERREATRESKGPGGAREARRERERAKERQEQELSKCIEPLSDPRAV